MDLLRPSSTRRLAGILVAFLAAAAIGAAPAHGSDQAGGDEEQVAVVRDDGAVESRKVSDEELAKLRGDDPDGVVERGRTVGPELAQAVVKVGAPTYWGIGHRGAGRVIAVIDTGVDAAFGGTIVGQACFAATQQGQSLDGHCGANRDATEAFDQTCFTLNVCDGGDELDPAAARPCGSDPIPVDCAHGSAVAAVAAHHDAPSGVAPDAGVYAIQVFNPTGRNADFVDILLALDHVADLDDAGMDIAAANVSLSTTATFPTHCDQGSNPDADALAFRSVFQRLRNRGIAVVAATGNGTATGGIGFPACVSNAIAVGASDLDDQIADFSNRGPTTDLVAPGADEGNGSVNPMDIPGNPVTSQWAGTSFAAPQVAGAFALLQDEYTKASVTMLVAHLQATARSAIDLDTGATYPRLRLLAPAQALPAGLLFPASASVAGTRRGAVGDFDGDGFGDVLAHAPGSTADRVAYGRNAWSLQTRTYGVSGSYLPLVGNFRGNAADDIVWYAPGSTGDWIWVGAASRTFGSAALTINGTYVPLVGNFDGDAYDDIAWYGVGSAFDTLWYGGPSGFSARPMSVSGSYRVAVGDVNGDSRDDLVFHGPGSASDWLWRGRGVRGSWFTSGLTIGGTKVLRTGDFDGDADDDLLLYEAGSGSDSIWRGGPGVGGGGPTGGFSPLAVSVNGTYLPSVADVSGDGRDDILWYAAGPTGDFLWLGRATGAPVARSFSVSGSYTPLLADLDKDAGADIVWFQSSTAATPVWWSHDS